MAVKHFDLDFIVGDYAVCSMAPARRDNGVIRRASSLIFIDDSCATLSRTNNGRHSMLAWYSTPFLLQARYAER